MNWRDQHLRATSFHVVIVIRTNVKSQYDIDIEYYGFFYRLKYIRIASSGRKNQHDFH